MAAKKPTYWDALGIEQGASKQKITAAYHKLAKELHPDVAPERAAEFTLVTAAFNVLKANPLHVWGGKSDLAWARDYAAATAKPKAEGATEWVFEEIEGESKEDRRKRYARTRQQWRYAQDPDFAAARRAASLKSHKKSREAKKAAKSAPAAAA